MPKKTKQSKEDINKAINGRATKARVAEITHRTVELLRMNLTYGEVKKVLQGEIGKSEKQCEAYITKALTFIREEFEEDAGRTRTEFIQGLIGDYKEAISNYKAIPDPENKMKATWFRIALEVKDRIEKFIPREQIEENEDVVNIEYNVLPFKAESEI